MRYDQGVELNRCFPDGFYVYTDVNQSAAYLVSPEVTLPHNRMHCLSFWYYVYGRPAAAILRVYIRRDQAYSRPEWSRLAAAENQWLRGEVVINTNAPLQVRCKWNLDYFFIAMITLIIPIRIAILRK